MLFLMKHLRPLLIKTHSLWLCLSMTEPSKRSSSRATQLFSCSPMTTKLPLPLKLPSLKPLRITEVKLYSLSQSQMTDSVTTRDSLITLVPTLLMPPLSFLSTLPVKSKSTSSLTQLLPLKLCHSSLMTT
jgi:hypothetical protein